MALQWDGFEWATGAAWVRSLTWSRRTGVTVTPYNLTGAAARFVVRTTDLATVLFRLTESDGISFGAATAEPGGPDPADGTINLVVSAARTLAVASYRSVRVDLAVKLSGATDPRELLWGHVKVVPGLGAWT